MLEEANDEFRILTNSLYSLDTTATDSMEDGMLIDPRIE
tara:strand:- start:382 stop:498 length:117 start_codon:yes stop_codon:yes gene_type:complete